MKDQLCKNAKDIYKNQTCKTEHIHTHKSKIKKSLAEMKQLIKLSVCRPSFAYRPDLIASGIMELQCPDLFGKALRMSYNGCDKFREMWLLGAKSKLTMTNFTINLR